ncbi:serine dehydratase beta chain [Lactobacillus helveticus]|uniref:L-serine ammonia-lyase n=1 Tax=Lactobacillus helveticus TaxID=1587 RepID=A0A3S8S922_LACHE|nr:serine dehydratase beta chain [Lactobacillus helveticus]AFR21736.1 L-serine dehydratase, beta subunit [Lactobacillus helveticus R0052]AZK90338.1 L-serine dehydratase, beta chain [Lactobacillus helveticus]MCJ2190432.1 serine dehydratase [Lactobacillus helveticus]MED7628475.1 serine dehydratase [Lactobacillus helveticus]MZR06057.1 serine dehydratase [Lactobacillus helveticus]
MVNRYKSVFDIIGPVMVGPSSSHTAGVVAIGRAGNKIFGGVPPKVTVHYYDSFAQTHRGHGTDYAIAAGLLGMKTDDLRVPQAIEIAREQGMDLRFVEEKSESPINHPNTAILDMYDDHKKIRLAGCSIGGGAIEIRQIIMDSEEIIPSGTLPIILFIDKTKNLQNEEKMTELLNKEAPFRKKQVFKAEHCNIYEYDIRNYLKPALISKLKTTFKTVIIL